MIRPFKGVTPTVDPSAFVDESAQVIGDVHIGEGLHTRRARASESAFGCELFVDPDAQGHGLGQRLIDFEDCGYGYWMWDFGVIFSQWPWTPDFPQLRDAFVQLLALRARW